MKPMNLLICISLPLFTAYASVVGCGKNPSSDNSPAGNETRVSPAPDLGSYGGNLERIDSTGIVGWAWDSKSPDAAVRVQIDLDDRPVATVTADQPRSDLVKNAKGNGKHGFLYPTPAKAKDGQKHTVTVRIAETNAVLGRKTILLSK